MVRINSVSTRWPVRYTPSRWTEKSKSDTPWLCRQRIMGNRADPTPLKSSSLWVVFPYMPFVGCSSVHEASFTCKGVGHERQRPSIHKRSREIWGKHQWDSRSRYICPHNISDRCRPARHAQFADILHVRRRRRWRRQLPHWALWRSVTLVNLSYSLLSALGKGHRR